MEKIDITKKRKGFIGLISVLAFFITYYAVQQIFFKSPSVDKVLMQSASELNKSMPMMIDKETRGENVISFPGNIFQYNYTLVSMDKATTDTNALIKYLEPRLLNSVKTNPDLKFYREHKVTMAYKYSDKNGSYLFKISITPEEYNK